MPVGGDYNTLSGAVEHLKSAHANLVGADVYAEIKIDGTWSSPDTTAVAISGLTTDATRYLKIYTTESARHKGVWSTSYYMLYVANAGVIPITSVSNVWIDGLQLGKSSESANYQDICYVSGTLTAGTNQILFSNCIGKHAKNNSYSQMFIDAEAANQRIFMYNCIDYNHGTAASAYNCSVFTGNGLFTGYNCTFIGGYQGVNNDSGTAAVCKNCYAYGSNAAYSGTITKTTCASNDDTGSNGLQGIGVDTDTFTNVSAGTENFHLPAGSPLVEAGTDTSGDAAPMNFTTDIDGDTRS
jgi:hypothetical protein